MRQVLELTGDSARIRADLALIGVAPEELRRLRGSVPRGPVSPGHVLDVSAAAARPGRA